MKHRFLLILAACGQLSLVKAQPEAGIPDDPGSYVTETSLNSPDHEFSLLRTSNNDGFNHLWLYRRGKPQKDIMLVRKYCQATWSADSTCFVVSDHNDDHVCDGYVFIITAKGADDSELQKVFECPDLGRPETFWIFKKWNVEDGKVTLQCDYDATPKDKQHWHRRFQSVRYKYT